MIIVGFVMLLLAFVLPLRARVGVGIAAIIVFALLVGAEASVVRASIMATLALIALAVGRQYDVLRALFVAGAVMLLLNPYLLVYDVGFQLSFMATLGLILIAPQFEGRVITALSTFGIKDFLVATVATQIAVLPLLLYHIGEFSLVAIIVNVVVLPVVPLAMLATFITGVIGVYSLSLALPLAYIAYVVLAYCITVVTWFADLPLAAVAVNQFPFMVVPLLYAGMGWLWWMLRGRSAQKVVSVPTLSLAGWTIVSEAEVYQKNERG
jgi:competence protein ComEC